jgi:hypothetical protein
MKEVTANELPKYSSDYPSSEKRLISSVITHEKLLDLIKERNPIIAQRSQSRG